MPPKTGQTNKHINAHTHRTNTDDLSIGNAQSATIPTNYSVAVKKQTYNEQDFKNLVTRKEQLLEYIDDYKLADPKDFANDKNFAFKIARKPLLSFLTYDVWFLLDITEELPKIIPIEQSGNNQKYERVAGENCKLDYKHHIFNKKATRVYKSVDELISDSNNNIIQCMDARIYMYGNEYYILPYELFTYVHKHTYVEIAKNDRNVHVFQMCPPDCRVLPISGEDISCSCMSPNANNNLINIGDPCQQQMKDLDNVVVLLPCGHIMCDACWEFLPKYIGATGQQSVAVTCTAIACTAITRPQNKNNTKQQNKNTNTDKINYITYDMCVFLSNVKGLLRYNKLDLTRLVVDNKANAPARPPTASFKAIPNNARPYTAKVPIPPAARPKQAQASTTRPNTAANKANATKTTRQVTNASAKANRQVRIQAQTTRQATVTASKSTSKKK